jgi:hypothetical protein
MPFPCQTEKSCRYHHSSVFCTLLSLVLRAELEAQIKEKAQRKATEKQLRLQEDLKKEAEMPWNRRGPGALSRTAHAQVCIS